MTKLLIALLLVSLAQGWSFWGYDSSCVFTRADAVACFARHVDTNKDGVISVAEVDAAKERYTGRFMRAIEWLVSWKIDIRTEKILSDCDYNHDGKFTADDFLRSYKTCVATQAGLCMIKKVCDGADAADVEAVMAEVKPPRSWRSWL
jgi:hypothetical protein